MTKTEEIQKLKQELNELRIKAQPLNTAIYIKECEIFTLEEELKEEKQYTKGGY